MNHVKKPRPKILKLPEWTLHKKTLEDCLTHSKEHQPIPPIYNRPGIYLLNTNNQHKCWMELPDGRAFTYSEKFFKYELNLLHAREYNHRHLQALKNLVVEGLATKQQRQLLYQIMESYSSYQAERVAFFNNCIFRKKMVWIKENNLHTQKGQLLTLPPPSMFVYSRKTTPNPPSKTT